MGTHSSKTDSEKVSNMVDQHNVGSFDTQNTNNLETNVALTANDKRTKSKKRITNAKPTIEYVSLVGNEANKPKVKSTSRKKRTPGEMRKKRRNIEQNNKLPPNTDDLQQCPICLERAYKDPRILPCCHTFCFPCLIDHTSAKDADNFSCPICRAKIPLTDKGIKDFQTNYFATADDANKCDVCREIRGENVPCSVCEKRTCTSCQKRHKCFKKERDRTGLSRFWLDDSSSDDSSDSDSSVSTNISAPYSFTRPTGDWSILLIKEETKFQIEDDRICVHIVKKTSDELWMLTGSSETTSIDLYKTDGTRLQSSQELSFALNFAVENSNSLLVPLVEEATICRFTTDMDPCQIVSPSIFHTLAVDIFSDGSILLAGLNKSNVDEVCIGCVRIISQDGEDLSTFTTGTSVPTRVCILNNDLICLAFQESHFLDVRLRDGNVVGKYNGNNFPDDDDNTFQPFSLAVSSYGRDPVILVSDIHTDTIHMISYAADFIGLLMKLPNPNSSDLGEPGAIAVDPSGNIWVAQRESNEVVCYSICQYHNVFS